MLQNSSLTIGIAVANQSGAMGSRYHFKNLQIKKKIVFLISFLLITSTLFGTNYDFTLKYKSYKVSNNGKLEKTTDEPAFMYISRDGKLLLTCGNNRYEWSFAKITTLTLKNSDKIMGFKMYIDDDNYINVLNTGSWAMIDIKTVCPYMNFNDCINEEEIDNIISLIESKSFFRNATSTTTTTTTNSQPPSGKIEKVWLEHNITDQYGYKGMFIHIKFSINNARNTKPTLMYSFSLFNATLVTRFEKFIPSYDNSEYNDFVYFFKYNDLSIPAKYNNTRNFEIELGVLLFTENMDFLSRSDDVSFTYNR